jgi:hypothetical protein
MRAAVDGIGTIGPLAARALPGALRLAWRAMTPHSANGCMRACIIRYFPRRARALSDDLIFSSYVEGYMGGCMRACIIRYFPPARQETYLEEFFEVHIYNKVLVLVRLRAWQSTLLYRLSYSPPMQPFA